MALSILIIEMSSFQVLEVSGGCFHFTAASIKNSVSKHVDPDETPHKAVSELGLHCLHDTPKRVPGLKRVNVVFILIL